MAKRRLKLYFSGIDTDEDAEKVEAYLAQQLGVAASAIEVKKSATKAIYKIDTGSEEVPEALAETLYQLRRIGFLGQMITKH